MVLANIKDWDHWAMIFGEMLTVQLKWQKCRSRFLGCVCIDIDSLIKVS